MKFLLEEFIQEFSNFLKVFSGRCGKEVQVD